MRRPTIRRYSELKRLKTFQDRFDYLKLAGKVGESTFGFDRYLNQVLYHSDEWSKARDEVIIRDNGCDLGVEGYEIVDRIIVHHMIVLTEQDILDRASWIFDPEFLICTSQETHNAIHYGADRRYSALSKDRFANDTCPWLL